MTDSVYDTIRVVTSIMACYVLFEQGLRAKRLWRYYTPRLKDYWYAFNMAMIVILEGSIESIIKDIEGGPRVILAFFAALVGCFAVFRARTIPEYNKISNYY